MDNILSSQEYKTAEAMVSREIQHYILSYLTNDSNHKSFDYVKYTLHRGPSFPESLQRAVAPQNTLPRSKDRRTFLMDSLVSYFNNFHTHIPHKKIKKSFSDGDLSDKVSCEIARKNSNLRISKSARLINDIYKRTKDDFMTCAKLMKINPKSAIEINSLKVAGKNPDTLQWCEAVFPMYVALRMFGYTHRELTG